MVPDRARAHPTAPLAEQTRKVKDVNSEAELKDAFRVLDEKVRCRPGRTRRPRPFVCGGRGR